MTDSQPGRRQQPGSRRPRRSGQQAAPVRLLAPATVAFIAIVTALGFVTEHFGIEAGLLALVLTMVALVVAPYVFLPPPPSGPTDPDRKT